MPSKNHLSCNFNLNRNLFVFMLLLFLQVQSKLQHAEICDNFNGRRMYIELGRKGTVAAKNLNSNISQKIDSYKQCRFEITTCPSCVVYVKFTFLNISQNCNKTPILDSCNCDYVWVYEPPFHDVSGHQFCGDFENNNSILSYRSQTRTLTVVFFYTQVYEHAFSLEYASERNRQFVQGFPGNGNETRVISTPFFPNPYSRDLNMEYVIRCSVPKNCRICLIFTDFLIAKMSVIEFFDWNGRRLNAATGMTFRPPTITSSGPSLNIRFYANGAIDKGFKIAYTFLSSDSHNKNVLKPKMNCGGLVDNLGGGITMMNVVKELTQFDCVWIVQPSRNFLHFYKHLYVKVVAFSDFDGNTELSIHQGLTSSGARVEFLRYPFSNLDNPKQDQHIIPISQGFYLRFKGVLGAESKLGIAYTAFSYNECVPGTNFLCKNQRCIPIYLQCDGFDHCGDNSDEPSSCFQGAFSDMKRHRWSHSSNFFFPKTDQYSEIHTAAIVFIVCCFGMIALILALIVLIFRINGRARQQREIENHLQAISDLLDQNDASIQEEIIEEDDPPTYEAPPNYDEVDNFEIPNNLKQSATGTAKQESMKSRAFKRNTCTRCSHQIRLSRSQKVKIIPRHAENSNCGGVGTSGSIQIPDSPPPAYPQICATGLNNNTEGMITAFAGTYPTTNKYGNIDSNNDNKQRFLAKHFSNDDFGILKKKVQQKTKKRKTYWKIEHANKFFPDFCESDLSHCLSDSEVSEVNSGNVNADEDDFPKIQRSFSLDDL